VEKAQANSYNASTHIQAALLDPLQADFFVLGGDNQLAATGANTLLQDFSIGRRSNNAYRVKLGIQQL